MKPTVQIAKKAILIAIADLESEESVTRRVDTWKEALPVQRGDGNAAVQKAHSITKTRKKYYLNISLLGERDVMKTERSVAAYTMDQIVALRDTTFLAAVL